MNKELIICIAILILIVIGDVITQNSTSQALDEVESKLDNLRKEMIQEKINQETLKNNMVEIQNLWNEKYQRLAYYIEHDELEKVGVELAKLNANLETQEYSTGVENLDNCVFILAHIKDKHALKVVNIF